MLGARIARLRKAAGMNQAELADRIGVSTSAIGMYEQGRREPSCALLVSLARALGTSIQYLVAGEESDESPSPPLAEVLLQTGFGGIRSQSCRRGFSHGELAVLLTALLTLEDC